MRFSNVFAILVLLLGFSLSPVRLTAQAKTKKEEPKEFFKPEETQTERGDVLRDLQQQVRELEDELTSMQMRMSEYDDLSAPRIRKEIKRMLNYPEQISEIRLANGTTVQGKILSENLDRVVVQTNIGMLSIEQENIVELKPYDKLHADVQIEGDFEDQHHSDKRVFVGKVHNGGLRRADFVRVRFSLHDNRTHIVAQDSAFVAGKPYTFYSGVISESSLEPNESAEFRVEVPLPAGVETNKITYITHKVLFDEFN